MTSMCPSCGATLDPSALSCPSCHRLVHAQELEALSEQAKVAERAGDWAAARDAWAKALSLLPAGTVQHRTIGARIEAIEARLREAPSAADQGAGSSAWGKRFARLGPLGVVLWKLKAIALFGLAKGKLLLLGLTKLSTFTSMLASMALYWSWYGWRFALGFVVSIYVHEMGHVAELRKFGIAATSPMFIPGLGAFVRLKQRPGNAYQDARIGLAGPVWGLGAAVVAWLTGVLGGSHLWLAIARAGVWINLFNLIPVWQLDGGRGFSALTRHQRGVVLGITLFMWFLTRETMLLLVAMGAGYRLFTNDYPSQPDRGALVEFAGLILLLSGLLLLVANGQWPASNG